MVPLADVPQPAAATATLEDVEPSPSPATPASSSVAEATGRVEAPEVIRARERAARGRANASQALRQAAERRAAAAAAAAKAEAERAEQELFNEAFKDSNLPLAVPSRRLSGKQRPPTGAERSPKPSGDVSRAVATPSRVPHPTASVGESQDATSKAIAGTKRRVAAAKCQLELDEASPAAGAEAEEQRIKSPRKMR